MSWDEDDLFDDDDAPMPDDDCGLEDDDWDETDDDEDVPPADENNDTTNSKAPMTPSKKQSIKETVQNSFLFQKTLGLRKRAGAFSSQYPNAVRHAITVCEGVIDFYRRRNFITLIRSGFQIFETIQTSNLYNFYQFARASDGFRYLTINKNNIGFLFKDAVSRFPKETITFKNNETCDCFHLDIGDIYFHSPGGETYIYYNENKLNKDTLIKFLVAEKFRDLDSNFLYLQTKENESGLSLSAWHPTLLSSKNADEMRALVSQFNDVGINRSLLLFGCPGVGKTSMAFKLLNDLKYRTIVFSASNKLISFDLIKNLIELLSIDAIIIDDFDQFNQTNKTLDLLEMFNKKCKVLIGIANTLKEFNVAILRPGRFDEVILVDQLDDECIKGVLGKYADRYLKQVQKWPIAFIQELVKKAQFLSQKELDEYVLDLALRVRYQVGNDQGMKLKYGKKLSAPKPAPAKKVAAKKAAPVSKKPAAAKKSKETGVQKAMKTLSDATIPLEKSREEVAAEISQQIKAGFEEGVAMTEDQIVAALDEMSVGT